MTDAFSAATAALFADDNMSFSGAYTPAGGAPIEPIRVLKRLPPPVDLGLGASRASVDRLILGLQVADVPDEPPRDSTISDGVTTWYVDAARPAARNTYWACDVRTAA